MNLLLARRTPWRDVLDVLPWRYYLGFTIGRGAALLVLPVVARVLGPSGLGQLEVALALMLAATIVLDAGPGTAIVRYWHDDRFERRDVLGAAIALQIGAAAVASILFVSASLTLGLDTYDQLLLAVAIVAFAFVEGLAVLGSAMLRSDDREQVFLRLSCVRLVVAGGLGSVGAVALGVPGPLLAIALCGIGFAALPVRHLLAERSFGTKQLRRRLARYGFPLVATAAAMWCLALSDRLFLKAFVSSSAIGEYSANYRLGSLVLAFIAPPLALMWLPVAQRTAPGERANKTRKWAINFTIVALGMTAAVTGAAVVIVPAVFGAQFEADPLVVGLIGTAGWTAGLYYLVATPLFVGDLTHVIAVCAIATICINLVLTPALIAMLGVDGAAIATALSYAALCGTVAVGARRRRQQEAT
jgi:O-antigen/teichoic acid export membrane protein